MEIKKLKDYLSLTVFFLFLACTIHIIYKEMYKNDKGKIILITQYYEPNNEERKIEIKDCLINNSKNKLIDEIHLFVEKDYDLNFVNLDKIKIIHIDKQLSFKKSFDYSNEYFDSDNTIILANSDIYFNNTLNQIRDLNYDKYFYALSRHNIDENNKLKLQDKPEWSQDVWIWKTPIKVEYNRINGSDFFKENDGVILGIGACDNRIIRIMKESGYNVKNIGNKIQCIHNHKNDYRNWDSDTDKTKVRDKYRKNGVEKVNIEN